MEIRHIPEPDLDLGHKHSLLWLTDLGEDSNIRVGALIRHYDKDGQLCEGGVRFALTEHERHHHPDGINHFWTLKDKADEHITLSPSIRCAVCGDHGYITDGKWVPA